MKYYQIKHRNGDVTVGKVKYGREEESAANQRHPLGPMEEGKMKHIDHLAIEEWSVTATLGEELRHRGEGRLREHKTIEGAVDHIANGTCEDERKSHQDTVGSLLLAEVTDEPDEQTDGYDAEEAEDEFAVVAAERHTESCALVLHETPTEPITEHIVRLAESHCGFDRYFDYLVEEYESYNYQPKG